MFVYEIAFAFYAGCNLLISVFVKDKLVCSTSPGKFPCVCTGNFRVVTQGQTELQVTSQVQLAPVVVAVDTRRDFYEYAEFELSTALTVPGILAGSRARGVQRLLIGVPRTPEGLMERRRFLKDERRSRIIDFFEKASIKEIRHKNSPPSLLGAGYKKSRRSLLSELFRDTASRPFPGLVLGQSGLRTGPFAVFEQISLFMEKTRSSGVLQASQMYIEEAAVAATHLIFLVPGIWETFADFKQLSDTLGQSLGPGFEIVRLPQVPQGRIALDLGGTFLAEEIARFIDARVLPEEVDALTVSFIAFGIGGLFARRAAATLWTRDDVNLGTFVSINTPHLGISDSIIARAGLMVEADGPVVDQLKRASVVNAWEPNEAGKDAVRNFLTGKLDIFKFVALVGTCTDPLVPIESALAVGESSAAELLVGHSDILRLEVFVEPNSRSLIKRHQQLLREPLFAESLANNYAFLFELLPSSM